tara:strand:+ start:412 stop:1215 length:804 start_codon:yes stop_codon:yes gene_type:complete
MIVHNNLNKNYWEDPLRYWDFDSYKDLAPDDIHVYVGCDWDAMKNSNVEGKKICCHFEEVFDDLDGTETLIAPYCDEMLTISKTASLNKPNRKYVYFPLNEKYLPEKLLSPSEKIYDACYTGNHNGTPPVPEIFDTLGGMSYGKYVLASFSRGTHTNVTYKQKLQLINESKITVTHNSTRAYAQLKSRSFEAAFNKSLILCCEKYCDYMEPWFTKDKHFITFKEGELSKKLNEVLNEYDSYHTMVEDTYDLAINNYTVKNFIKDFIC